MSQVTMREKTGNSSAKRKLRTSIMYEKPKFHRTDDQQDVQLELDLADDDEIVSAKLIPDNSHSSSEVWDYFNHFKIMIKNKVSNEEVEVNRHFCVYPKCNQSYTPGQSLNNLRNHLAKKHSVQVTPNINTGLERKRASDPDQFKLQRLMTLFIISSGNHLFLIIEKFKFY